jgi:hypothetical protein
MWSANLESFFNFSNNSIRLMCPEVNCLKLVMYEHNFVFSYMLALSTHGILDAGGLYIKNFGSIFIIL